MSAWVIIGQVGMASFVSALALAIVAKRLWIKNDEAERDPLHHLGVEGEEASRKKSTLQTLLSALGGPAVANAYLRKEGGKAESRSYTATH